MQYTEYCFVSYYIELYCTASYFSILQCITIKCSVLYYSVLQFSPVYRTKVHPISVYCSIFQSPILHTLLSVEWDGQDLIKTRIGCSFLFLYGSPYCQLLTVTESYYQLLMVFASYWSLGSITDYYKMLMEASKTYCQLIELLDITEIDWLLQISINRYHYWKLLTILIAIDNLTLCKLSDPICLFVMLNVILWLFQTVAFNYWMLFTVIDCHNLSVILI